MEKEKKTVTVEIPEGKKAVWNEQGILQLVDEKKANEPKDVTERIKTIYDAVNELAEMVIARQNSSLRNTFVTPQRRQVQTCWHT